MIESHVGLRLPGSASVRPGTVARRLFVNDVGNNAIEILQYHGWSNLGSITNGINYPAANWVDKKGNLYVANTNNANVTEYDSSGNLIFTYSSGIGNPTGVTTDKFGAVYESDGNGNVSEFPQRVNRSISCVGSGAILGVAVDAHGDVFTTSSAGIGYGGSLTEYKIGLIRSSCVGTVSPITFNSPFGLALDLQNDVIVCDRFARTVDVIAPPYTSITGTLGSGWSGPVSISIDRLGTHAYVSDFDARTVAVLTYPGGSTVTTLGSANGLSQPSAAIASNNYAP